MRWNCPHCQTTLNLKLDLDKIRTAHAQCGACSGISLLVVQNPSSDAPVATPSQSAPLPQTEMKSQTDIKSAATPPANPIVAKTSSENSTTTSSAASTAPTIADQAKTKLEVQPPPFIHREMEEQELEMTVSAAQPPKPPAFLLKAEPILAMPTHFSTFDDEDEEEETREARNFTKTFLQPTIVKQKAPLAIALVVATVSGLYLYSQIRKILEAPESPRVASVEKSRKR